MLRSIRARSRGEERNVIADVERWRSRRRRTGADACGRDAASCLPYERIAPPRDWSLRLALVSGVE